MHTQEEAITQVSFIRTVMLSLLESVRTIAETPLHRDTLFTMLLRALVLAKRRDKEERIDIMVQLRN